MTTGERIKRIRMVCDLTQAEFAKEIGVNKESVSVWELDKEQPSDEILNEIADMFLVDFEELKHPESSEIQSVFKPNNAVKIINNEIRHYENYLSSFEHDIDEKVYFGIRMKIETLQDVKTLIIKQNTFEFEVED